MRRQRGTTPLGDILPVLGLESLRSLTCSKIEAREEDIQEIRAALDLPHITQLSLFWADIHPSAVIELLRKPPHLTHLSYTSYAYPDGRDISSMFLPCLVREGLMHSENSLQELRLVNEVEVFEKFDSGDEPLPLGSLVGFDKLRKLDASVYTFIGRAYASRLEFSQSNQVDKAMALSASEGCVQFVDSLPQSLEELIIRNCRSNHWSLMEVLLEKRRKGKLRKLNTITLVSCPKMGKISRQEELAKYVHEGKTLGIAVAVSHHQYWRENS